MDRMGKRILIDTLFLCEEKTENKNIDSFQNELLFGDVRRKRVCLFCPIKEGNAHLLETI